MFKIFTEYFTGFLTLNKEVLNKTTEWDKVPKEKRMNIAVRYLSKTGNTEKVARAIAESLGVQSVSLSKPDAAIKEETDVLFLGAAVYWFGIDSAAKSFIQKLDKQKVKKVVVFSTSALAKCVYPPIKKLLSDKGIPLSGKEFHCWGKFTCLHSGRPNAADLERAKVFAKEIIKQAENGR
jgi:flavodoxin